MVVPPRGVCTSTDIATRTSNVTVGEKVRAACSILHVLVLRKHCHGYNSFLMHIMNFISLYLMSLYSGMSIMHVEGFYMYI